MKEIIIKFKTLIKFSVSIFACREFGFVFCLIGTIGQIAHTYYLTNNISSLDGGWRIAQAVMLSIFISASLLYFVSIADNEQTKESKRIHLAVNIFMVIEILINFYYYSRHLLLDSEKVQIFDFVFAVLVSCLIPVTIKLYAGLIHAKDWLNEIEGLSENPINQKNIDLEDLKKDLFDELVIKTDSILISKINKAMEIINVPETSEISEEKITEIIKPIVEQFQQELELSKSYNNSSNIEENLSEKMEEFFNLKFTDIKDKLNKEVIDIFDKNQKLFLNQFENKCTMLLKEKMKTIQS